MRFVPPSSEELFMRLGGVEWSEVIFFLISPPFQRGQEECLGRDGDFFSAFQNGFS